MKGVKIGYDTGKDRGDIEGAARESKGLNQESEEDNEKWGRNNGIVKYRKKRNGT